MNFWDILIIVFIGTAMWFAFQAVKKNKGKSCNGCDKDCNQCNHHFQ